ncbi:MAG: hypothetical protein EU547_02315 [Promethearchaeota archaeon]|nr:MAG: hypothetical protein EU547_02315 [Candidatus Lokiarchaeota archaeon]
MFDSKEKDKEKRQAIKSFENIKDAITGIYQVLRINIPKEDIYYQIGIDNIIALYTNILDLTTNKTGLEEIIEKVSKKELHLDIPLD